MQYRTHAVYRALFVAIATCTAQAGALAQQAPVTQPTVVEPTLDITRYSIEGDNPLSTGATEAVLKVFTGEKRALSQIEQAATALEQAIRAEGYVFHRVFVPVQKPKDGEVTLQIIRFVVDKVTVTGNKHFSTENIRRSLPALVEGAAPDIHDIGRDLISANENPSKQVQVTFRESEKPDAVDASLRVKDNNPLTYFVGYTTNYSWNDKPVKDNVHRFTAGVQHSNLFDRDQVGAATYTTDPNRISKVTLLGLYYQMPIYGTGLNVSAYYNSSDVNSGQTAGGIDVSGKGEFVGVRITQALSRTGALQQKLGLALDNRYFENNSTFGGALLRPNVGSRPLSVRYSFRQDEPWGGFSGSLDYARNIGGGTSNNVASYTANAGDRSWDAWRYAADVNYKLSDWLLSARWRGQTSGNNLIAGEQFGLGGAGSVRGFADRVVSGDSGYQFNFEAIGPELGLPQLRPVFFVDGGQVRTNFGAKDHLLGLGVGLRWSYEKIDVSVDLAQGIDTNRTETLKNPVRINFSLFYRF